MRVAPENANQYYTLAGVTHLKYLDWVVRVGGFIQFLDEAPEERVLEKFTRDGPTQAACDDFHPWCEAIEFFVFWVLWLLGVLVVGHMIVWIRSNWARLITWAAVSKGDDCSV